MPRRIDLNADLGEGVTDDVGLLGVVTSANVACGFHAGDMATMRVVCEIAAERGVAVGAQVSYLDRDGFGRRAMEVPAAVLTGWVAEQVQALSEIALGCGTAVTYLKPHGALYNRVIDDAAQAEAVLEGAGELPVLTLPLGEFRGRALAAGREVRTEGFPDRGYREDGHLLPRSEEGALVEDPAEIARNAVDLAVRGIDSVCVHGDSPGAVAAARGVRQALTDEGYTLAPLWVTP
ncbi:MAG: LamB/YcsF family protein [Marmoricola sp.]